MFVDVLKRYLLIVWNFFFGQGFTDSIQDSPNDQPVKLTDTVPSTEVDKNVLNEKDIDVGIEEDFDNEKDEDKKEEEEEEEEEEEDVDDEVVKEVLPKKPEVKTLTNDVPSKPSATIDKAEEVKVVTNAPSVKIPEPLKVDDIEIKDKEKLKNDVCDSKTKESSSVVVKKEETPKLKPEFEMVESEDSKAAMPVNDLVTLAKPEFEIIERETSAKKPSKDANQEFEVVEKEAQKVAPGKEDVAEMKSKETASKAVVSGKDNAATIVTVVNPPQDDTKKTVKFEDEVKGGPTEQLKEAVAATAHLNKADNSKVPAVIKDQPADKGQHQEPEAETISNFVVLEKGEGEKTAGRVDTTIDSFLLGEQRHSNGIHHPETSIQDQQL